MVFPLINDERGPDVQIRIENGLLILETDESAMLTMTPLRNIREVRFHSSEGGYSAHLEGVTDSPFQMTEETIKRFLRALRDSPGFALYER